MSTRSTINRSPGSALSTNHVAPPSSAARRSPALRTPGSAIQPDLDLHSATSSMVRTPHRVNAHVSASARSLSVDPDGCLTVTGRSNDIFLPGGENGRTSAPRRSRTCWTATPTSPRWPSSRYPTRA